MAAAGLDFDRGRGRHGSGLIAVAPSDATMPIPSRVRRGPLLFLLVPIAFYALSVAYGGVPIFVPPWWPFSHYNVRYGLQLLPAFAAALAVIVNLAVRSNTGSRSCVRRACSACSRW